MEEQYYIKYALFLIFAVVLAFTIELMILPRILFIAKKRRLYDSVNERKSHTVPTPRLGGISFFPVIIFCYLFMICTCDYLSNGDGFSILTVPFFMETSMLICASSLMLFIGVKDDIVGARYSHKFAFQILAAGCFLVGNIYFSHFDGFLGLHTVPYLAGTLLTLFIILFITNAVNLIDGIDGLASGLILLSLLTLGSLFIYLSAWQYALLSFISIGVLLPFFFYNVFYKSRKLFMGDTGALSLGLLLAYLCISYTNIPAVSTLPFAPIVVVSSILFIPLFDTVRVVFARLYQHQPIFVPDRNHVHHKLLDLGCSHRMALLILLSSASLLILLNGLLSFCMNQHFVLLIDLILAILFNFVLSKFKKEKRITN